MQNTNVKIWSSNLLIFLRLYFKSHNQTTNAILLLLFQGWLHGLRLKNSLSPSSYLAPPKKGAMPKSPGYSSITSSFPSTVFPAGFFTTPRRTFKFFTVINDHHPLLFKKKISLSEVGPSSHLQALLELRWPARDLPEPRFWGGQVGKQASGQAKPNIQLDEL